MVEERKKTILLSVQSIRTLIIYHNTMIADMKITRCRNNDLFIRQQNEATIITR